MLEAAIQKVLTKNDTSETGAHQAGICIPKDKKILSFFPNLDADVKNPRTVLSLKDELGNLWYFSFVYYNNKKFGGTRNEYRLTGMTGFIRQYNLKAGDAVIFHRDGAKGFRVKYQRSSIYSTTLKLSSTWKLIDIDN